MAKKIFISALLILINVSISISQTTPIPDIFSPVFSHLSGRYNSDIQVELTSKTTSADIFYTLDGSTPDISSQKYNGSISISGNGSLTTLKSITIKNDSSSSVSSATYAIDYDFDPNADYLTDLSWAEYNSFLEGDWFGYASTPWTKDYCIRLKILSNGNYIDKTTSGSGKYPYDDAFTPVFYYGISAPSDKKKIELYDMLPSGYANGFIDIVFSGGNTNTDQLRYIKFIDSRNLYLEMWHHDQYGPLKYYLTKNELLPTSTAKESLASTPSMFPNPASEFVMIKNAASDITLTNQLGQTFTLDAQERISISHIPAGFYIVNYRDHEENNIVEKLVIQ